MAELGPRLGGLLHDLVQVLDQLVERVTPRREPMRVMQIGLSSIGRLSEMRNPLQTLQLQNVPGRLFRVILRTLRIGRNLPAHC